MKVQVVNRNILESPNFMKLSCHALNETLNSIRENINVLNISLIPF